MSRLIESIKLLDGNFLHLSWHEQRMRSSLRAVFGHDLKVSLDEYLNGISFPTTGLYKCRIVYDERSMQTTFAPYQPKPVRTLKIVEDDDIAYDFKFTDRGAIERLFTQRGSCDDILILRDGHVTDSSIGNIVFGWNGSWYTPARPLLKGVTRQRLLSEKKIVAAEISKNDIRSFDTVRIINAMLEFGGPEIDVSNIVF